MGERGPINGHVGRARGHKVREPRNLQRVGAVERLESELDKPRGQRLPDPGAVCRGGQPRRAKIPGQAFGPGDSRKVVEICPVSGVAV